ncbi:MAG: AMP-binding protein, partial [Pseudomonadota bacterium]
QEVRLKFEKKFNQKIIQYYGATETTRVVAADPAGGERRLESVGLPVSDVKVKILDPAGGEAPVGQPGEICVQMPGGMIGYWGRPKDTAETLKNGWLHTGDIGKLDQDGFLYLLDRKKDMMIVSGYNVYPAEIENILHEDPRILEAAVIGVPDERSGEKPLAFVILKKGEQAAEDEIISLTREKLAVYNAVKKVKFVDNLPKSPIGKVLKKFLRQQYLSELETGKNEKS